MKHICILFRLAVVIFECDRVDPWHRERRRRERASGARVAALPTPRTVDLKAADGMPLKATYFAAARPGPCVLLFHQVNRTRKSWDDVAEQLAAAGINTLTSTCAASVKAPGPLMTN